MGLTAELASAVGIPVHRSGSLELIPASDADRYFDECARVGIRILGLEGFRLVDGQAQPDMSAIADLSGVQGSAEALEEARAVVAEVGTSDLMLEFTLARVAE